MSDRSTPATDALVEKYKGNGFTTEYLRETVGKLERQRNEVREELARIESLLLDPHAVFLNFLHGKIAKLDWAKLEHIHGPHPARVERDEAQSDLAELRARYNELLGPKEPKWYNGREIPADMKEAAK